jgi:sterol desaturase/sphingolipid hydroxylase (fatty acid hydroxylase superfamily)
MSVIIAYAVPIFLLLLVLEALVGRRGGVRGYEVRDTFASLAMGLGNVGIAAITKGVMFATWVVLYEYRLFDLGHSWWVWPLLIVAEDFCYYWFHRAHHEVRLLWAAHVNHHSSQRYNLSTALRQSWTTPFTGPLFWLPLPLIGFDPVMILTAQAISLVYQFWIHTEHIDRLGPLEWIFNTPSHHRVHHGSNPEYLDRNHGGILIIWDRLFGTFEKERAPVHYGLTTNIETYNPIRIAFHEWGAMLRDAWKSRSVGTALAVLVRSPAWRPPRQSAPPPVVPPGVSGQRSGG